jgi:hypothetical protein
VIAEKELPFDDGYTMPEKCEICSRKFGTALGEVSRSIESAACVACWLDMKDGIETVTPEPEPFLCRECGKPFTGEGVFCARCYVAIHS